jgi:4-alpha-glucanotransferase
MSQTQQGSGRQADSFIVNMGRQAGVCLHFTSLPGHYGSGDIGAAAMTFIDHLEQMGIGVWQFLPTGPTAYGDSPYQPLSAFAGNALLIDLDSLVRLGLLKDSDLAGLECLPRAYLDYDRAIPARLAMLSQAAEHFRAQRFPSLVTAYDEFLHRHERDWLNDYAMFRVLKSLHDERAWPQWEKRYMRRQSAALRAIVARHGAELERVKFAQFLFDHQWRELKQYAGEKGICLYGDMPIYIALDSADAWTRPEMLQIDRDGRPSQVAGVPPDYFSADGQLWGNPLYDWEYHQHNGYRWWIDRTRHALQQMSLVRIDHFRGFESFWSVPAAASTARFGAWEPGPGDALFDALSQSLGGLPIVAEDLGVITPEVVALRLRHGLPGMRVLQFDVADPEFDPEDIEENCVCYTGTHDNDTTVGWFGSNAHDTRTAKEALHTRERALTLTGGSAQTIHLDMIRLAFSSRAALAIAPMQDYLGLGSGARLNIPGSTRGNWRWRLRAEALPAAVVDQVAELTDGSGRAR